MTSSIKNALRLIRRAFFFSSFTTIVYSSECQVLFNKSSELSVSHVYADGFEQTGSGYVFVASIIIDTQFGQWGYGIGALNEVGNISCFKEYVTLNGEKILYASQMLKANDSLFIKAGTSWNPDAVYLAAFNDQCDTLFTRHYKTVYGDSLSSHIVQGLRRCRDGGYIIATGVTGYSQPERRRDMAIYKLDANFELEWSSVFGRGNRTQQGVDIAETSNGGYLIFGIDYFDNDPEYDSIRRPLYFIEVDSLGNLVKEKVNGQELRSINFEIVQTDDGGYILCSSQLYGEPGNITLDNSIFKLNKELDYVWETKAGTIKKSNSSSYHSIIASPDGTGVIAAGTAVDSIDGEQFHYGVVTKVDWDGQGIWSRYYTLDNSEYPTNASSTYIDRIRSALDGGYIAIGSVYFFPVSPIEPFKQQIWFLKMDEFGCVVPGCHLPSSTMETESNESEHLLSTFPGPFSEVLNVFVRTPYETDLFELRAFDFSGNQVFAEQCQLHEISFRINTQHWPSGGYILSVWIDGVPVRTIKTIKQ